MSECTVTTMQRSTTKRGRVRPVESVLGRVLGGFEGLLAFRWGIMGFQGFRG